MWIIFASLSRDIDNLEKLPNLQYLNLKGNPNLPEYFATDYKDAKAIANLRQFSGLSNEELRLRSDEIIQRKEARKAIEIKEKEEKMKKEAVERQQRIEREAYFGGSIITSTYGGKLKILERQQSLLKSGIENQCFYCKKSIQTKDDFSAHCAFTINELATEMIRKLPRVAKDRDNYTERKVTQEVTNRRMDIYDRPGTTFVTKTIREYKETRIQSLNMDHFPKLQGIVCKDCGSDFIRKAARCFNRLKRKKK